MGEEEECRQAGGALSCHTKDVPFYLIVETYLEVSAQ